MSNLLFDYIQNVLAPKEYRLELKNRLENLCSLSGTPMSSGLSAWMTDTFGLEMTRVVQDYSTFSSPKLSPDLLSVLDRIVPSNYQGYDANLGLKQLFDVSCPVTCFWFASVVDNVDENCFLTAGWDINGEGVDFPNAASTFGGYFVQNGYPYGTQGQSDSCNQVYFMYVGDSQPAPLNITDPATSFQTPFGSFCEFGCLEVPSTIYTDTYTIFNFFGLSTTTAGYGGVLDFSDLIGTQATLESIIKSYFTDATVTIQDDGGGFYTVIFNDVWYDLTLYNTDNVQWIYNGGVDILNTTAAPC